MDTVKIGMLIRMLRKKKGLTQKQLADKMYLSDRTVSKWERGHGCPDVSVLTLLSEILEVKVECLLNGSLSENDFTGGNMKNTKYYVCNSCGNISLCTGSAEVSCCGKKLEPLKPEKAGADCGIKIENIEDDWYITFDYPMTKKDYISFVAFASGERINIFKQYPEWPVQVRFQRRGHGMLLWYSERIGLMYRLI